MKFKTNLGKGNPVREFPTIPSNITLEDLGLDKMKGEQVSAPREWWIFKGNSNFFSQLEYDVDTDSDIKSKTDGFYDVVSVQDTIDGGIHVIEKSAYDTLKAEKECYRNLLSKWLEFRDGYNQGGPLTDETRAALKDGESK